jgi:predicted aspartyl protease
MPMNNLLRSILCVLAFFFLVPSSAPAASNPPPQTIKLERFRKALWTVRVTLNGKTGDFLFDTGGGNTMVTERFAADWGCEFWGRTTGYNMFGERIDTPHCDNVSISAGGVQLTTVHVGKIDFGDRFAGDKTPEGLLSLDAFDGKIITIDQSTAMITIESEASLRTRIDDMRELPLRISRECSARCLSVFLGVARPEGMTWLTLDTGAGGVSLIAREYARTFGLDPNAKEQRLRFEIADDIAVDSPVIVTDMIMDGNLGQPFLSQHLVTLDLATGRIWIQPRGHQTAS